MSVLTWIAQHGRFALLCGLGVGIAMPGLAHAMQPMVWPLVVFLLFLAGLRLGPNGISAGAKHLHGAVKITMILQLLLPLAAVSVFWVTDVLSEPLALGLTLMLMAPPITGSPHMAVMVGAGAMPALRQLVVGTTLLPLTSLPILWLVPAFGGTEDLARTVLTLLACVLGTGAAALLLHQSRVVRTDLNSIAVIDGIAAVALSLVVIGLMSAVGPALRDGSGLAITLMAAFAANIALQACAYLFAWRIGNIAEAPALAIIAGNRNIALFLGVLPPDLAATLLLFIGCYQIPMYLTPVIMRPLLRLR